MCSVWCVFWIQVSFLCKHPFTGDKLWRYTGFKLDQGFPKRLSNIPANIDSAFYFNKNQKIIFFKVRWFSVFLLFFDIWTQLIICSLFQGSGYWQWDEIAPTDFKSYPKPVGQLFKGMPSNTDAAITWTNGYVYIFKGTEYWRVNQNYQAVEKTYPLNTALRWMQCDDWATRGHWGLNIKLICTMTV